MAWFCMARSIYAPITYRYFDYKHRSEVDSLTVESVISSRRFHIYEEVWSSVIGEVLVCRDTQNRHDPFAVATCKGMTVVGHVPRWISAICYVFLEKPGASITCSVAFTQLQECAGGSKVATELKFASSSTPCKFRRNQDLADKTRCTVY